MKYGKNSSDGGPRQQQEGLDRVLSNLQGQVIRRSVALIGDRRPEVRTVLENNLRIMEDLERSTKRAARSRRVVDFLLPGKS